MLRRQLRLDGCRALCAEQRVELGLDALVAVAGLRGALVDQVGAEDDDAAPLQELALPVLERGLSELLPEVRLPERGPYVRDVLAMLGGVVDEDRGLRERLPDPCEHERRDDDEAQRAVTEPRH